MVTIILPVSRATFLKEIFENINSLKCTDDLSLFVYVDGDLKLFEKAKEFVRKSDFEEKICIYRKKGLPNVSHMMSRRKRISAIHDEIKTYIKDTDFVFLMEDDTLVPEDTLIKLFKVLRNNKDIGFVSGIELGRWGFAHIGAWVVDNVENPQTITSIEDSENVVKVDAAGLYCCLMHKDVYLKGNFEPFEKILGPDVSFGLGLRKQGLINYADESVKCVHKTPKNDVTFHNSEIIQVRFTKNSANKSGWELEVLK